ncbi:MAG: hypothetical protein N2C12_12595, partial [Planctomycetales bacterium]
IMPWRKGVLISAAPDILYAEDTNGDGVAEKTEILYSGFGTGNQQHRVNGFEWGLDNWIYLANGSSGGKIGVKGGGKQVDIRGRDIRIQPDKLSVEAVAGQSQFGRFQDNWGNWFGCNNPNPIFHFVLADHYLRRNPHLAAPASLRDILDGNRLVYPLAPVISHCDTRIRPIGAPTIFTSANSTTLYRDDLFGPSFSNITFTSEPVYNLVHRRRLIPDGVTFRSQRLESEPATEFMRSSDPWFRPTRLKIGPDGALYVADMVREVIEHPEWIDDETEKQIDVRAGHEFGRIYRVLPVGLKPRQPVRLDQLDTAGLVATLESPSGWQRDMAQRMLIWQNNPEAPGKLEIMAADGVQPLARLHALCTLDGLNKLKMETISIALSDDHAGIRRHALRLAEPYLNNKDRTFFSQLQLLCKDPDPHVVMQAGYSAAHLDPPLAGQILGHLAIRHADDPYISAAVLSSLNQANVNETLKVALGMDGQEPTSGIVGFLSTAAVICSDDSLADILQYISQSIDGRFEDWQPTA